MHEGDSRYTKFRWVLTAVGLILYIADILIDTGLALKYFQEKHYAWAGLTVVFVLAGVLVTHIFSYVWYEDDKENALINTYGQPTISGMCTSNIARLHLLCIGVLTRYYLLLKTAFGVVWTKKECDTPGERRAKHHRLFCDATDLSYLKLFEAFLESVPQLLLQMYIVLGHDECSVMTYFSIIFSYLNISWALVDYRRCMRRSLPDVKEMPSGLPTLVYFLYKLCTITSIILSYSLFLMLSAYSLIGIAIIWLLSTIWANILRTNFCKSIRVELLYRAVVGVILTFTFFNVKGQDTKVPMTIYYCVHSLINITAPLIMFFVQPELQTDIGIFTVSGVIVVGLALGLVFLVLYYRRLHPRGNSGQADEVDGLGMEADTTRKIRQFLQP